MQLRRLKIISILAVTVLLFFAIGIGIESVYGIYFHLGNGFKIYALSVVENAVVGMPDERKASAERRQQFIDWAREHDAAIVVDEHSGSVGVCDCSGRVQYYLRRAGVPDSAPTLDDKTRGVYISNEPGLASTYVKDGIFRLGNVELPVLGYYDKRKMPEILSKPYIYSYSEFKSVETMVWTDDWNDSESFRKIMAGIDDNQFIIEFNDYGGVLGFISLMFYDPTIGRSHSVTFFILISLALCAVFGGLMMYRELRYFLQIRHLVGMTRRRMGACSLGVSALIVVCATALFSFTMEIAAVNRFENWEKLQITAVMLCVSTAIALVVNVLGMLYTRNSLREGIRHEGDEASYS